MVTLPTRWHEDEGPIMESVSTLRQWDEQSVESLPAAVPGRVEDERAADWEPVVTDGAGDGEDTVVVADAAGTIRYVNLTFEQTTGYSRYEVIGKSPYLLRNLPGEQEFFQVMCDAIDRGTGWSGAFLARRADGTLCEAEAVISPVYDVSGRIVNHVAVKRVVRPERRVAHRAGDERRGERTMEAVGRLAGGIAHEFNNLLTVIIGYSDLLLSRLSADDAVLRKVGEIKKAGERAALLTHQLLAYSRRQMLRPRTIFLNDLVCDMERFLRCLMGEKVDLVTILRPVLGAVEADPVRIEQALIHLAVNARDAMPDGGRLTIETANVELSESTRRYSYVHPGSYVMLAVHDTGCGMNEEIQSHLFEPFFTTKEKAAGLGLATIYGTVKQSGGYIWASSKPGRGSTFTIHLPRVDATAGGTGFSRREA
jgi:two-component system, cell cycle sensor histidine kinase and response regulator CckA